VPETTALLNNRWDHIFYTGLRIRTCFIGHAKPTAYPSDSHAETWYHMIMDSWTVSQNLPERKRGNRACCHGCSRQALDTSNLPRDISVVGFQYFALESMRVE